MPVPAPEVAPHTISIGIPGTLPLGIVITYNIVFGGGAVALHVSNLSGAPYPGGSISAPGPFADIWHATVMLF